MAGLLVMRAGAAAVTRTGFAAPAPLGRRTELALVRRPPRGAGSIRASGSTSAMQANGPGLNILVFQGSTRTEGPPRPACVGQRVALWVQQALAVREHAVQVVGPLETPLIKPHFAYAKGRAPEALEELSAKIRAADAFVMVTPEYNHAPSPALLNTLNHFGSSLFSFKPSAIVSYSQGQWYSAWIRHTCTRCWA